MYVCMTCHLCRYTVYVGYTGVWRTVYVGYTGVWRTVYVGYTGVWRTVYVGYTGVWRDPIEVEILVAYTCA